MTKLFHLRFFLFGLFVFCNCILYAQNQTISGKIVSDKQEPLSFATVIFYDSNDKLIISATTDNEGKFIVKSDNLIDFFIRIRHLGYHDFKSKISELNSIVLFLLSQNIDLVEVKAKENVLEVDRGAIIYNVENTIGALDISVLDVLKRAPEVYVENERNIPSYIQ